MDELRARLLSLPNVSQRRMFGTDCFLAGGRMFAFFFEGTLVLKLPDDRYPEALALPGVQPMEMRPGTAFGKWARFPLAGDPGGLDPWVRTAHEHVLAAPPKRPRRRRP